jgi:hypothetical protein
MPSPFPGMDPYLEGDEWTAFHASLAIEIARQLTLRIRPKYVAVPQKRFDLVDEGTVAIETIYPDVGVASATTSPPEAIGQSAAAAPCVLETVMEEVAPHTWVEIRDVAGRSLVTTIEILSPWNKRGQGRVEYMERRQKLLRSSSHLVEIDLLRRGQRLPMKGDLPPGSYYVFVGRADERPRTHIWQIALDSELPTFGVPLLVGDADVDLELQACFQIVYDLGGFDLLLDYSKPPAAPLEPVQAAWAAQRLRAAKP